MHTTAHAHGMVGRFRHNQKPFHDATTEKRRKVKFLFFFSFSSPDPLMCPTDSETGFGHRHHRFGLERVDHGGRQTLGRANGFDGNGMGGKCPFSVFSTTTTKATRPDHSDTITIIIGVAPPNRTEISFGDQLLASVCPTDSICVCHVHRSQEQDGTATDTTNVCLL